MRRDAGFAGCHADGQQADTQAYETASRCLKFVKQASGHRGGPEVFIREETAGQSVL